MSHLPHPRILIIDFGSQYTQLIARRVRELGVYCEIFPYYCTEDSIKTFDPQGIILSGSPKSVTVVESPVAPEIVFSFGCPVLGICYGMQTMAMQLGGQVETADHREYGFAELNVLQSSPLFTHVKDMTTIPVWMSHGDRVSQLPAGFTHIGSTHNAPISVMADEKRRFYGIQFHAEVTHTPAGKSIIQAFVSDICKCAATWTPEHIIEQCINHVREQVGNDRVILALSGGVDSTVVATLLQRAIGEQLTCVFVDTGLSRLNEPEQVLKVMREQLGVKIIAADAADYFLTALEGENDPEQKRKIIGKCFIDVFEQQAKELKDIRWLVQGTIYSDVIESAAVGLGTQQVIKSHHNVGGLPERMNLKLLEPVRELFKDEVRQIGLALGLPRELVFRHPFPGPGLAVRILGAVQREYITIVQQADAIFIEELRKFGWYEQVAQAFAVFLPVKSVAVMGDARQYEYVIALRAVRTTDFMTAEWAMLPHELLGVVSNRIINEVQQVSRVTYDISSKPPATIEWE
ncbi:MAG: glutamine-hydrolyzing GMP synthase [Gammaproteobacteria bacterium]